MSFLKTNKQKENRVVIELDKDQFKIITGLLAVMVGKQSKALEEISKLSVKIDKLQKEVDKIPKREQATHIRIVAD